MTKEIFGILYLLLGIAGITCGLNWIVKTVFTQLSEFVEKRNQKANEVLSDVFGAVGPAFVKMLEAATADIEASNKRKESYHNVREFRNDKDGDDFEL